MTCSPKTDNPIDSVLIENLSNRQKILQIYILGLEGMEKIFSTD